MFDFIETEHGWVVFWGPPPKDLVNGCTPRATTVERDNETILAPVICSVEEGATAVEFHLPA